MVPLLWLNTSLLAVLLLHYCVLGVIVTTMMVVFSQVVKLSGGIVSTIVVDPVHMWWTPVLLPWCWCFEIDWWHCYHGSGGPQ